MINWFGLESHKTDSFIHWTEKNPIKVSKELREVYDKIVEKGLEKELTFLLRSVYEVAELDTEDGRDSCF